MSGNRWNCGNYPLNCAGNGWGGCSPYYNGPCPDADGDYGYVKDVRGETLRGGSCCCQRRPEVRVPEAVQGRFASPSPLTVIAGAAVPLIACGDCHGIDCIGGGVQLEKDGVYYASITATIPAGETLETTLTPTLNGAVLPAGILEVDSTATRALPILSGQLVFRARSCDRFAITTSEALSSTSPGASLVNVDVMRISE